MKKTFWKLFILLLLALLATIYAEAQPVNLTVLNKNESFTAPEQDMIVLDKYSFGKYHYTAAQCDTLKKEVVRYDSLLDAKDSTIEFIQSECKQLYAEQQKQIADYAIANNGLQNTANQSFALNEKLQVDYKQLENKNKRIKRWRNFFMGTALLCTSVLVLIVVH